jgi:PIN domain nuclease of toxin-antitoxin system
VSFFLLDTHLLLWAAGPAERLSRDARSLIEDEANVLGFSVASIWEVAIKTGRGRGGFVTDPSRLRRYLLDEGYRELAITSDHVIAAGRLPPLHQDPFDRLLVGQADVEGATLLTVDAAVARYAGSIRLVA